MDAPWTRVPALGLFGPPAASHVVATATRAERLGFGSLWVAEDYFYPSAFPVGAAAAAVTRDLVIATGVVNPYTRHPLFWPWKRRRCRC
jgi:alkanesulfonate monooxygenase SsuD/methylene tetrahydromethanopterin reductase-like flavin-dependent oxidoreductase (luciferase family)